MFVWVDAAQDTPPRIRQRTRTMMRPGTPCWPAKDETIAALREQLAQVNERDWESRRTIAALTQRISELPSARPASSAAEWAEDEEARREEVGMSIRSDEQRQSWWRKMFGG